MTPEQEAEWFDATLTKRHYLGAWRPVGDYLRQVARIGGETVALLVWGPCCYSFKYRNRWIGWSANQRVERLKLHHPGAFANHILVRNALLRVLAEDFPDTPYTRNPRDPRRPLNPRASTWS